MVMVLMESAVSGHKFTAIRERLVDKLEVIRFDPYSEYKTISTLLVRSSILLRIQTLNVEEFLDVVN